MPEADYAAQVADQYLAELRDTASTLTELTENLRSGGLGAAEGMADINSEIVRLRQLSHWVEVPLLDLAITRLLNYTNDLESPTASQLDDVETFLDIIAGIIAGELDGPVDEAEFVRSLPARRPVDLADLAHLNVEILLVEPQRTTAKIFERELQSIGYRVTTVNRSFAALELAVRTRPDMVIASAMVDELSGVDLACAMGAMPATETIPFALLTSFERADKSLARVPDAVAVLRKGRGVFGEDLADALARFHIT